ncbi:MAG: hypothetical protein PHD81_03300 [Candidatus Nanoarchaeia archaeon]|nr:hypothetical protein [Candidatus Nanoarchaeia archaeon]MDD5588111.1 hypothetical protein [Candidatus Nanoarchaeia archaeon]
MVEIIPMCKIVQIVPLSEYEIRLMEKINKYHQEFIQKYLNNPENFGSVSLRVAESRTIVPSGTGIESLFGLWEESKDDEKNFKELYKSRLIPSSQPQD